MIMSGVKRKDFKWSQIKAVRKIYFYARPILFKLCNVQGILR